MRQNAQVYILQAEDGTIKVGHSVNPEKRMHQLGRSGLKVVHASGMIVDAEKVERAAHKLLKLAGKHVRGEWFSASIQEALDAIDVAQRIADGLDVLPGRDTFLQMRIADEIVAKLDDLRRVEADLPSRSEMIRRLIERADGMAKKDKKAA